MKFSDINIKFKGIEKHFAPKNLNICVGNNGAGKTTILDALRFLITGDNKEKGCVEAILDSGDILYRGYDKTSSSILDRRKVTVAALNSFIEDYTHVPMKNINIVSSSDIIASLSPDVFQKLLIGYIPEELTADTIVNYIKDADGISEDEEKEIRAFFTEEKFGVGRLNEAFTWFRDLKKDYSALLKNKKVAFDSIRDEKPTRSLTEIEENIKKAYASSGIKKVYEEQLSAYEIATKKKKEYDATLWKLRDELSSLPTSGFSEEDVKNAPDKIKDIKNKSMAIQKEIATISSNIKMFENTLSSLSKPICPISAKIICTTDKTALKDELEELLDSNKALKEDKEKEANKLLDEISKIEKEVDKYNKLSLVKSKISALEKASPEVPKKPEMPKEASYDLDKLLKEKKLAEEYHKKQTLKDDIDALSKKEKILNKIYKCLSDKGCVKDGIMNYYMSDFASICNNFANKFFNGYEIRFIADEGIKILVKAAGNDGFYEASSLSSGEKIVSSIIIADMLNQLSGLKLLFIDNIEALDKNNLINLANLLKNSEFLDRYDHIFVSGVNHTEVIETIANTFPDNII